MVVFKGSGVILGLLMEILVIRGVMVVAIVGAGIDGMWGLMVGCGDVGPVRCFA